MLWCVNVRSQFVTLYKSQARCLCPSEDTSGHLGLVAIVQVIVSVNMFPTETQMREESNFSKPVPSALKPTPRTELT